MQSAGKFGTFCLIAVAIAALISQAQPAHADKPTQDVAVVNTPSVNIGTPTVHAKQSGPWTGPDRDAAW